MGISVKSSFSASKQIKRITAEHEKRLGKAMEYELGKIIARTEKGQGADGKLKGYSKAPWLRYDKKEEKWFYESYFDYKKRTKGDTTVNLTESGKMLQGMQSTVEKNANGLLGKIFFLPTEQQKARWNIALRPNFFKLAKSQFANIVKTLRGK